MNRVGIYVSQHCDPVSALPVNSTFGTYMLNRVFAKTLSVWSERAVTPQTTTLSPVFVANLAEASPWPHFGMQSITSDAGRGDFGGDAANRGL